MFAVLPILAFLAVATLAMAVIASSLAKGLATVSLLRRQITVCDDTRLVRVRHERGPRAASVISARAPRRTVHLLAPHPSAPCRRAAA
jgi:hypothetical protein